MRFLFTLIVLFCLVSYSQKATAQSYSPVSWTENGVDVNVPILPKPEFEETHNSARSFDFISILMMEDETDDATMLREGSDYDYSTNGLALDEVSGSSYEQIMPTIARENKKTNSGKQSNNSADGEDDLQMKNYTQTLPSELTQESKNGFQKAGFLLFGVFGLGLAGFACWIPMRIAKPPHQGFIPKKRNRRTRKPRKPLTNWL